MREVVYTASRELYRHVVPSIKSLLAHTHVDRVHLLIEDDGIGEWLPDCVEVRNVSSQSYFRADSPNMTTSFTYLALMRAALCYELDAEKVLSLDCDVFVQDDISELFDVDLADSYFCAAVEPMSNFKGARYYNTGVCVYNLALLRNGKADEIIHAINSCPYQTPEQDALNFLCQGRVKEISGEFNGCDYTVHGREPKTVHLAGIQHWWNYPIVSKWRESEWVVV